MPKKTDISNDIPEGYEEIVTNVQFIKLDEGDAFEGIYHGTRTIKSRKFGNKEQIAWEVSPIDSPGELMLLPEKTTMENFRLNMEKETQFFIKYTGKKQGETNAYKTFKFAIKPVEI